MNHHRAPTLLLTLVALLVGNSSPVAVQAGDAPAEVGAKAPTFTLPDTAGSPVKLEDFAGKTVVLEWFNADCPFVRHAHGPKGPLKTQPGEARSDGVVWLAINSSAPGLQGHGEDRNARARTEYAMDYPVLLDPSGEVGRAYGAKTTPHMYVIDGAGTLVYAGGLDGAPMGRGGDTTNHVAAALADLAAGREVAKPTSKPYGCSVKYGPGGR